MGSSSRKRLLPPALAANDRGAFTPAALEDPHRGASTVYRELLGIQTEKKVARVLQVLKVDLEEDPTDGSEHAQTDPETHPRDERGTQREEPPESQPASQEETRRVFLSSGPTARIDGTKVSKKRSPSGEGDAGRGGGRAKAARTTLTSGFHDWVWEGDRNVPGESERARLRGGHWGRERGFQDTGPRGIAKWVSRLGANEDATMPAQQPDKHLQQPCRRLFYRIRLDAATPIEERTQADDCSSQAFSDWNGFVGSGALETLVERITYWPRNYRYVDDEGKKRKNQKTSLTIDALHPYAKVVLVPTDDPTEADIQPDPTCPNVHLRPSDAAQAKYYRIVRNQDLQQLQQACPNAATTGAFASMNLPKQTWKQAYALQSCTAVQPAQTEVTPTPVHTSDESSHQPTEEKRQRLSPQRDSSPEVEHPTGTRAGRAQTGEPEA